jgi:hypothetical protein
MVSGKCSCCSQNCRASNDKNSECFSLNFSKMDNFSLNEIEFDDDIVYFAYCYPYTYTELMDELNAIMADPIK